MFRGGYRRFKLLLLALVSAGTLLVGAGSLAQDNADALPGVREDSALSAASTAGPSTTAGSALNSLASGLGAIPAIPAMQVRTNQDGSQDYTVTLQILAIMTGLTLLPAFMMTMTSFVRITIVFSILRQAIGLHQTPSNQILMGMALFLTIFIMSPVLSKVNETALQPYIQQQISSLDAVHRASAPFHDFMLGQTRQTDLDLFMRLSNTEPVSAAIDIPFFVLAPAFVTSELKTAFQIGFALFIPFLVIDMVVASVLMAMGMMMLSPIIISLPFKIMLFVLVDGWAMVIGSLAASFGV